MSIDNRIDKIEKKLGNPDLFPAEMDFEKWSDEELYKYIVDHINLLHIENAINSVERAEKIYGDYLKKELITKETYDLLMKVEKIFYEEAEKAGADDDNSVFFIDPNKYYSP